MLNLAHLTGFNRLYYVKYGGIQQIVTDKSHLLGCVATGEIQQLEFWKIQ